MRSSQRILYSLYRFFWLGVDFLYPPVCGGCGEKATRWCENCQNSIVLLPEPICEICGLPQPKRGVCSACERERPIYAARRSWAIFGGPIRKALHRLKYRHDLALGDTLAAAMLDYVNSLNWRVDIIVPVPLGKRRMKERGYNQVSLIARPLALAKGWQYAPRALERTKETRSQVGLSIAERKENVENAFLARRRYVDGKKVLLLDDVSTTGATLNSCAEALIRGGARQVYVLSLAKALSRHGLVTV